MAREDNDAVHKLSITQAAASKHDVIGAKRNFAISFFDITVVLINKVVGNFTVNDSFEVLVQTLILF